MQRSLKYYLKITAIVIVSIVIASASTIDKLAAIFEKKALTAGIMFSPLSYYEKAELKAGLEYELIKDYAQTTRCKLKF